MYQQRNVNDSFHQEALKCPHGSDHLGAGPLPDTVPGEWVGWFELIDLHDRVKSTEGG